MTMREAAFNAVNDTLQAWKAEGGVGVPARRVAEAVAEAVLREVIDRLKAQGDSDTHVVAPGLWFGAGWLRETALAEFSPAPVTPEPPPCSRCGYPENHVLHFSAHQAFHQFAPLPASEARPTTEAVSAPPPIAQDWQVSPENGPDYDPRQFTGGVESIDRKGFMLVFTFGAGGQICVNHGVTYVSPERH